MTEQEKELLLKDLCARLPYGVKVGVYMYTTKNYFTTILRSINPTDGTFQVGSVHYDDLSRCKPYLRPMSSMTEEERNEFDEYTFEVISFFGQAVEAGQLTDWLNAHHFDYRGLIEKGLAIESPEGMYDEQKPD